MRDIYADNNDNAKTEMPSIIDDTNEMTAGMIDVLDTVKEGTAQIETPLDAVRLMMERMGVSEEDVGGFYDLLLGYSGEE